VLDEEAVEVREEVEWRLAAVAVRDDREEPDDCESTSIPACVYDVRVVRPQRHLNLVA